MMDSHRHMNVTSVMNLIESEEYIWETAQDSCRPPFSSLRQNKETKQEEASTWRISFLLQMSFRIIRSTRKTRNMLWTKALTANRRTSYGNTATLLKTKVEREETERNFVHAARCQRLSIDLFTRRVYVNDYDWVTECRIRVWRAALSEFWIIIHMIIQTRPSDFTGIRLVSRANTSSPSNQMTV